MNETTRHAHVILPPVGPLERPHYDVVFHALAVRNTAKWAPPLFTPPDGTMADWQILSALTERLQPGWRWRRLRERMTTRAMRRMGIPGMLSHALAKGPYARGTPQGGPPLTLTALTSHPHGVDLGPLVPMLPGRLRTASGKIHAAPAAIVADLSRVARGLEAALEAARAHLPGSLLLVGRRALRSNNSWMHNSARLVRGKPACTLLMHPQDAAACGVADGAVARVTSRVGTVEVPVEVTDAMMPGVASLPHGWGHGRPGVQLRTAATVPGVSINDLTDDARVDALCGVASFSGTPITVAPAER